MGSEWAEEQAGPEGPVGPAGGSYTDSVKSYLLNSVAYSGTAEDFINLAFVSGLLINGARYRITAHIPVQSTNAGDVAELTMRLGSNLSAPIVASARVYLPVSAARFNADFSGIYDHAGADVTAAFNFTCRRADGAGIISVRPTSTDPIHVELQRVTSPSVQTH